MKTLFKNGSVLNVFTESVEKSDVLVSGGIIAGVGQYDDSDADRIVDVSGMIIAPGLIDGHIHIESTMLLPDELARAVLPHGTVRIVADPHEIANVCGADGIRFMMASSAGIPLRVNYMVPSCVPATPFDEAGAVLGASDIAEFYDDESVLGLAEMMNYPGVLAGDAAVRVKIEEAVRRGKCVDGHAPLLRGRQLDAYISAGISSDHECSSADEAFEKLGKGQWIMIREGTAARNLEALLPLFEKPFCGRCCLVTDDKHPADLLASGHIDAIIRKAVAAGKSAVTAFKMATVQAAQRFGIADVGAVAPGYAADFLVLDSLENVSVRDVYVGGTAAVERGSVVPFASPDVPARLKSAVSGTVHLEKLSGNDFFIDAGTSSVRDCRVIGVQGGQLLTKELRVPVDFSRNNGIDCGADILKLAVIERHKRTGHKGIGFIHGIGLKRGAIASTVSHDSHNLIVIGTSSDDMACAANEIIKCGGGCVYVADGAVVAEMPLPVAGLMSDADAATVASENENLRRALHDSGVPDGIEPFLNTAFVSLPVIPDLKMTTLGLVDVNRQKIVPLFTDSDGEAR